MRSSSSSLRELNGYTTRYAFRGKEEEGVEGSRERGERREGTGGGEEEGEMRMGDEEGRGEEKRNIRGRAGREGGGGRK